MATFPEMLFEAERKYASEAEEALRLYKAMCGGKLPPRVPGMSTRLRLAWRIANGRTSEEAAAREYLYRWRLALGIVTARDGTPYLDNPLCNQARTFGAPHLLGM